MTKERQLTHRMREATQFCKRELDIQVFTDVQLSYEDKVNFEKCLTQNYLLKHGMDYFGKRDLIFIDLFGDYDVKRSGQLWSRGWLEGHSLMHFNVDLCLFKQNLKRIEESN